MTETKVFARSSVLKPRQTHYCPGCGHGIVHRLVAEAIEQLGVRTKTIGVAPVGCAVLAPDYFDFDMIEASHGRAPAIATGLKRARPDMFIMTYQGDGDLAAIGTAEIVHAANRGENISVIFVNNAVYGMTGGQMAPTTLVGQKTATSPEGRSMQRDGKPIRVCELLATLDGVDYIARTAIHTPAAVRNTRKAIVTAFQRQLDGRGFTLVEVLSPCPTYWRLPPVESMDAIDKKMIPYYPLGVFKDKEASNVENAKA